MHLEELSELASRRISLVEGGQPRIVKPMEGLLLLQQHCTRACETSLYEPVLCLILRGRKQVSIGRETLSFGPGECLLVSHAVPASTKITKGPYMSLVFQVDPAIMSNLYDEVAEPVHDSEPPRVAETHKADPGLIDALGRYLALADSLTDARVLQPLISREIHYRLLTAPFGRMLRSLIHHDSNASAIARAIGHIRSDVRAPIVIPELARRVGMSASSFHKHFRTIAATTPLQYQKDLRLLEARRLLKAGGTSVSTAAYEVGYESSSQFSREYVRKFGVPPSADVAGTMA